MTTEQAFQQALALSKIFTKKSLLGGGAVAGKNVIISNTEPIEGGNRITFSYTLDDGTVQTSNLDVMDGRDGIGIPAGGTAGQVLVKSGKSDYEVEWKDRPQDAGNSGFTMIQCTL